MKILCALALFVCAAPALQAQMDDIGHDLVSCQQLASALDEADVNSYNTLYTMKLNQAASDYTTCVGLQEIAYVICLTTSGVACDVLFLAGCQACTDIQTAAGNQALAEKAANLDTAATNLLNNLKQCSDIWGVGAGGDDCDGPGSDEGCVPNGGICSDPEDCESGFCDDGRCTDADPIIVDLTGAGFPLTSRMKGVPFDFFGKGSQVQMAWTAPDSGAGWLVLDRNGNGKVDSGAELFSNVTPQDGASGAGKIGFRALAEFDRLPAGGNGDGLIDSHDAIFSKLRVWVDRNHDGISSGDELLTMEQAGIQSISLSFAAYRWTDLYGNQFRYRSRIRFAGEDLQNDRYVYDVVLTGRDVPRRLKGGRN